MQNHQNVIPDWYKTKQPEICFSVEQSNVLTIKKTTEKHLFINKALI